MIHFSKESINKLDRIYRLNLINSCTGYKSANLIGSVDIDGNNNLAIFSSVTHLGSNPPLISFILRPKTETRDTYDNILATKYFTVNHVNKNDIIDAHHTSAKYPKDISEFDELNIEKVYIDDYKAPFVKDSLIKIGLHKVEEIKLLNRCRLIVGKVELVVINNNILESDGNIDFSKSTTTCISGCQNYYNVKLTKQKQRVKS